VKVVIPNVAGIGNALMAQPMVRQLKRKRPDAHVTILARIGAIADVFRCLGSEVDETIVTGHGYRAYAKMAGVARKLKPDLLLIPFPSSRWHYAVLIAASGAKRAVLHSYPVGYWAGLHFLGGATRVPARRGIHDVEQNLALLPAAIGCDPDPPEAPIFPLSDEARRSATSRIGELPESLRPIVIHAGSANNLLAQSKRWSSDKYAQLIEALSREYGAERIVLVEGPDEAGVAREILRCPPIAMGGLSPRVMKLSGPLTDAAALLERAALYVGSDSGLAHLAAAVKTPPVTIFAPADPDRVSPFGYRHLVVQTPTHCSPCLQYPWNSTWPKVLCREPFCVQQVTVEAVLEKVHAALSRTPVIEQHSRAVGS
jgi:ADP-heptose:LPS heptosyltransferase